MVHLVTNDNSLRYSDQLAQMHVDRKRVFVDRLKWDVPVVDGLYEIDQFDTAHAVYLLELDPSGRRHLGSIRLLPSTRPHILGAIFPFLCEGGVPEGDDVWEISRLCVTPGLARGELRRIRDRLATAAVEFGLLYGIRRYTLVASTCWLSPFLGMGWECHPLGLPQDVDGEMLGALVVHVSPETLQAFRRKANSREPVLRITYLAEAA